MLIMDWQRGKIPYYCLPPGVEDKKPGRDKEGNVEEDMLLLKEANGGVEEEELEDEDDEDVDVDEEAEAEEDDVDDVDNNGDEEVEEQAPPKKKGEHVKAFKAKAGKHAQKMM
jgi:hypothetical protein